MKRLRVIVIKSFIEFPGVRKTSGRIIGGILCVVAVLGAALIYGSICNCCSSPEADTETISEVERHQCRGSAAQLRTRTGYGLLYLSLPLIEPTSAFPNPFLFFSSSQLKSVSDGDTCSHTSPNAEGSRYGRSGAGYQPPNPTIASAERCQQHGNTWEQSYFQGSRLHSPRQAEAPLVPFAKCHREGEQGGHSCAL